MKKFTQLVAYCWIIFLASCNSGKEGIETIAPVSGLNDGSSQILHDIAVQNITFLRKVARGQMLYKNNVNMSDLIRKVKSGEINLNDTASALSFYKEISLTPELYADYVNRLYEQCKKLNKLNANLSQSQKIDVEKVISLNLDAQYSIILSAQANARTDVWDSFMGPGSSDNFGYEFRHQTSSDVNESIPLNGGGNEEPNWAAFAQCSQSLNIALDRCFRNFALHMAAAAALSEAPPAAAGVIAEAIVENYFCKEDAFQDMDICVGSLGYYRKK